MSKRTLRFREQLTHSAISGFDNRLPSRLEDTKKEDLEKLVLAHGSVDLVVRNWNQEMGKTHSPCRGIFDHRVLPFITMVHLLQELPGIQRYDPLYIFWTQAIT